MRSLFIGAAIIFLAGCSPEPQHLALHVVVAEASALDGRTLTTQGTVRMFEDPEHYWIEDSELNRVGLHGVDFSALVGNEVQVTGRFSASAERGRHLDVTEFVVLSE
ncbi:hypothetical protein FM042_09535 [Aliidiomarina halalkaliphila]|uniref:Glucose-inhibited division protein B n=1 Tax=Aliidiomarina halalkaliphila TaxID=2593535 RepID=A0A552X021_9GAMM|nr:hypothetical protein [Aliidiomarina halalkaliphila]TRW48407.1 hypothetical protein FM042_09535 [Aliidiomarina halalkaliphila]